jgi:5-methyltetrahydropteroyltriglutamate--homocysteine methyltransferase
MVDTLQDDYYADREKLAMIFGSILNEEATELADAGVDVIQFDEPAFNVFLDEVPAGASRRSRLQSLV